MVQDTKRLLICFQVVFHSFILRDLLFASFCLCIEPLLSPTDTIQVSLHCLFFKLVPPSIIFSVHFASSGGFVTVVALIFFLQILTCLSPCPFVSLLSSPGNYFRSPPSCYPLITVLHVRPCLSATPSLITFRLCPSLLICSSLFYNDSVFTVSCCVRSLLSLVVKACAGCDN